jgi:tetratricopeptide (TPR) repeat protein
MAFFSFPKPSHRQPTRNLLACALSIAALLAAAGIHASAQQAMDSTHNMADMRPIPAPDQLPVPIRMTGIGNSHIAIKASPEAQAWFDQGLTLYHDFWDYESAKAFQQAIRVDPNCAMCWWGLAESEGLRGTGAAAYGKRALAQAERLKNRAGAEARLYIEAAEAESNANAADSSAEIAILRKLVKKQPHDPQARIFLADALGDGYDDAGEPKPGTKERIAILASVIRDFPNDSAANHYWIHAQEPGNHPDQAIQSAALLASLAPNSGHMVHMPGHIYYRVGNYSEAERWFRASTDVDEHYLAAWHETPDNDWNYVHNMMYAIANLMEQGKLAEANALSDHLSAARGQLSASLYIWSARDQMARVSRRLPVALRVGDWDTVLALLSQANLGEAANTANLRFLAAELSSYARGMKALEQGNVAAAQSASAEMDAGLWRVQQDQAARDEAKKAEAQKDKAKQDGKAKDAPPTEMVMPDADPAPLMKSLSITSVELRASVLVAEAKLDEAKRLFAQARADEKKLGYHEPPYYIRPVGETEAAALLRAKDYVGARAAYQAALAERPNSGFGLYGLARATELSGDAAAARAAYQAFLKAWPSADPALPEIAHARSVVDAQSVAEKGK